ncbi:MAG: Mov34/MPN/PAD-1 family protein [Candidatus Hermodarchaeota archaeon]
MKYEKDMVLFIDHEIYNKMKECVKRANPNEACGLLFGTSEEIKNPKIKDDFFYHYLGKRFECIQSDKKSPVSFLIDNIEYLHEIIENKIKESKISKDLRLISIFHSHPGSAYPSGFDEDYMQFLDEFSKIPNKYISRTFKNQIWTIINANNYNLNGFIYLQNDFLQIEVKIINKD